jgi:hypothetical protein
MSSGETEERDPVVAAYRAGLDLTLIDRNLELTPEERLRQLMELQRFADELRAAGRRTTGS